MKIEIDTEVHSAEEIHKAISRLQDHLNREKEIERQIKPSSGYVDMFGSSAPEDKGIFSMFDQPSVQGQNPVEAIQELEVYPPQAKEKKVTKEILDQVITYY